MNNPDLSTRQISSRRVVITGLGLVSPLGLGVDRNWKALLEGENGIGPITKFDASAFSSQIAGEAKDFDPLEFMAKKESRKMDPFIQYAVVAAAQAVDDAGIDKEILEGDRTGVYVGSGIGGIGSIETQHEILLTKGPNRVSPFFLISSIVNEASGQISIKFKARGPNSATATA